MPNLARYLQQEIQKRPPRGWSCFTEKRLLDDDLEKLLGFEPQADLLLCHEPSNKRLWVEFEISRADPVANHVKFAAAHLWKPQAESDVFISMMSPHIVRGRRNLSSSAILLMRSIGMDAFQTVLLPGLSAEEIKRINHLPLGAIADLGLPVEKEVERLLCVSETVVTSGGHRIHYASDPLEVIMNIRAWNGAMKNDGHRELWGRRRVRYFAFDPQTGNYAPSKFCAFVPLGCPATRSPEGSLFPSMTIPLYASLDESETRFDGHIAWKHLANRLGFEKRVLAEHPHMVPLFERWLEGVGDAVQVDMKKVMVLVPPAWFVKYR